MQSLPDWVMEFLCVNPHPSLSFLPIDGRLTLFLQNDKPQLEELRGNLPLMVSFYQEDENIVMSLRFFPQVIETVETPDQTILTIEQPVVCYETVFERTRPHIEALLLLKDQDFMQAILFDRHTGYVASKRLSFRDKKGLFRLLQEAAID